MQKMYLLLRNNVQTGPFTIDELFQQQLKPGDLIWIEGKSTAWAHPSDFDLAFHHEEVKPEPAPQPTAAADDAMAGKMRTGNLVPEKDLEKRAEEIKRHVLESVQQPNYHKNNYPQQPMHERKTIYQDNHKIHFTYRKANKGFDPSHVVAGMLVVLLIVVGWYNGWSPINENKGTTSSVAIPGMQEMKTSVATPAAQTVHITSEQSNAAMAAPATDTVLTQAVAKTVKPKEKMAIAIKSPEKIDTQLPPAMLQQPAEEVAASVNNNQPQQTEEKAASIVVAAPKQEVATSEEEGKKKKFGQVIAGIFKKKKKDDSKQAGDEKDTTDNNN